MTFYPRLYTIIVFKILSYSNFIFPREYRNNSDNEWTKAMWKGFWSRHGGKTSSSEPQGTYANHLSGLNLFITMVTMYVCFPTGDMWSALCKYGKEIAAASSVHIKLYSYLYQLYHRYDCDTETEPDIPEPASIPTDTPYNDTPQGVKQTPGSSLLDGLTYAENQS